MLTNLLLFSGAFLLFTYIVFRVKFKKDYKNIQRLSPISSVLGVLVFFIHANSYYLIVPTKWLNFPQMPENQTIIIIFTIILGIGIIVLFLSWFRLGTKTSMGVDKNKLQTHGLYKYSRNPQLVGYGLILVSFVILYFSYLSLIWFLLYIISTYFMIKSEEEFLKEKYKDEYKIYCRQVPRVIKI
jgi:protein-S-isoprenylcysteine O-methyltransferase Ste14